MWCVVYDVCCRFVGVRRVVSECGALSLRSSLAPLRYR